jgi:hypothetical protein
MNCMMACLIVTLIDAGRLGPTGSGALTPDNIAVGMVTFVK